MLTISEKTLNNIVEILNNNPPPKEPLLMFGSLYQWMVIKYIYLVPEADRLTLDEIKMYYQFWLYAFPEDKYSFTKLPPNETEGIWP